MRACEATSVQRWCSFALLALLVSSGCATIRKFNSVDSRTLESRQLTQQAEAAIHLSKWADAEHKLVQAVTQCPDDNRARSVLADVLWQRGEHHAAVEQKRSSINLSGQRDPYALTELGQMELAIGNLRQSLMHADEAIRIDPTLPDAWTLRGFVLRTQGKHKDALSAFFRSLSIRTDDPRTRLEIAKIYRETDQPQRGLSILGAVVPEDAHSCPHHPEICYLRGLLMRDLDRPTDSVAELEEARDHGCAAPDLLYQLAESQLASGDVARARSTLEKAEATVTQEQQFAVRSLLKRIETELASTAPTWR